MAMAGLAKKGFGRCFSLALARPAGRRCNPLRSQSLLAATPKEGRAPTIQSSLAPLCRVAAGSQRRRLSDSAASDHALERRRRRILSHALRYIHDEGWTDDAVAAGALDAGLPPASVGLAASSAAPPLGSAELVAFFMDECNADLRKLLAEEEAPRRGGEDGGDAGESPSESEVAERLGAAMQLRLSLILPFVASNRWHEAMAIGALPHNFSRTARQLEEMAGIALEHAAGRGCGESPVARAAVVAAHAAAELHLLSDGADGAADGGGPRPSLGGERHRASRAFAAARAAEAARLVVRGPQALPLPSATHLAAATAVASSLAGAALSLAAPSAAAALPRAAASVLTQVQSVWGSPAGAGGRDGTQPGDYAAPDAFEADLPPFDASEEIFPQKVHEASPSK